MIFIELTTRNSVKRTREGTGFGRVSKNTHQKGSSEKVSSNPCLSSVLWKRNNATARAHIGVRLGILVALLK